jgi:hypothetical protein
MLEDKPRYSVVKYFEEMITGHNKVLRLEKIEGQLYRVVKKDGYDVLVYLADIYRVSEAEVIAIKKKYKIINCIVLGNLWNDYSEAAKGFAAQQNIGLFMITEFMGALNYSGQEFIYYIPKKKREQK